MNVSQLPDSGAYLELTKTRYIRGRMPSSLEIAALYAGLGRVASCRTGSHNSDYVKAPSKSLGTRPGDWTSGSAVKKWTFFIAEPYHCAIGTKP